MSGSVFYSVPRAGINVGCDTPSTFRDAMVANFGDRQGWQLSEPSIPVLMTIYRTTGCETFHDLVKAIERTKIKKITVWMEY